MGERDGDLLARATAALREAALAPDPLVAATLALRAESTHAATPGQIAATRVRLNATLETRHHGRSRPRIVAATILATIATGALSWAAVERRLAHAIVALAEPATAPGAAPRPASPAPAPRRRDRDDLPPQPAAVAAPAPIPVPVAPTPTPVTVPSPPPRPARRAAAPPAEDLVDHALYRAAHDAHFRGRDSAAALAAWDAYLAERPDGRFAIEARYNRAIALVRLHRDAEARVALTPFADGAVEPAGYRQADARALLDALDRRAAARAEGAP